MKPNNYFSLKRVSLLLNRQLNLNYKSWIIAVAAISGMLLIISLLASYKLDYYSPQTLNTLGIIVLFIGGYIFTSQIFIELNDRIRGLFYLTLPASILEKLFVSWLMSSIGFVAVIMSMLALVSLLASGIASMYVDTGMQIINPFNDNFLNNAGIYLVTQSVFCLGAVYFQKFNFLKTLLSIFLIYLIISIWTFLTGFLLFHNFNFESLMPDTDININLASIRLLKFADYLFWGFMAPYFLFITYLRLNEREV